MTRLCLFASASFFAIHSTIAASFAATTFHSDRASFNNAAGPLVTEDFESANLSSSVVKVDGLLNDQTDNGVFSPGDIQSGLTVWYPFPFSVVDAGYVTGTSKMVRDLDEGRPSDRNLILAFEPPITSLGFDIFGAIDPGPSQPIDGFGTIERSSPTRDERFSFPLAESSGAFVGIISNEPFSLVSINLAGRMPAFIDNISFSTPIPEPAASTLLILAFAGLGLQHQRYSL